MFRSVLRLIGAMLSWRLIASWRSLFSSASMTSAASITALTLEMVGHASHDLLLVGRELSRCMKLCLLLRYILRLLRVLDVVPDVWTLWTVGHLIVVVVVTSSGAPGRSAYPLKAQISILKTFRR